MSEDRTTVSTVTTVDPPPPHPDDDHDGALPEPPRDKAWWLWAVYVVVLSSILVAFAGTFVFLAFTPKEPEGSLDTATLVGLFGLTLAALRDLYRRQPSG